MNSLATYTYQIVVVTPSDEVITVTRLAPCIEMAVKQLERKGYVVKSHKQVM